MAVIYIPNGPKDIPTISIPRPFQIYPNWDFWIENIRSGNPGNVCTRGSGDCASFVTLGQTKLIASRHCQGCQIVCFQTKNPNLGKFGRALDWKMLIYFMPIWNILQTFGIFYNQLSHFVFISCIFFQFWYHVPRKIWQPRTHCKVFHEVADIFGLEKVNQSSTENFFQNPPFHFISGRDAFN
jgi:hypothetical protein